jgi:hypothetical protein
MLSTGQLSSSLYIVGMFLGLPNAGLEWHYTAAQWVSNHIILSYKTAYGVFFNSADEPVFKKTTSQIINCNIK